MSRFGVGTSLAVLGALLVPLAPAQASLADVGPVAANGYPAYYTDASGLTLRLCDDPADGCTMAEVPNPSLPVSFPENYPGESFYFAAASGSASYEAALEAAFTGEEAQVGENIVFSRIRIRMDGLVIGARYEITHPYGTLSLVAEDNDKGSGEINYTDDQGCLGGCGDFRNTLPGFVGDQSATSMNFLTRVGFNAAGAAAGAEIGNPTTPTAVTGSPFDTNYFEVVGPDAGGPGVNVFREDTFTIEGQVYGPTDAARPSTPDLAAASDSGRSSTDNITNNTTPTFTGTAAAGAEVTLMANGTAVGTAMAGTDGTYSVTPSAALAGGAQIIKVSTPNPAAAADPTLPATLESGTLNMSLDVTAPATTIGTPRPSNGTIDATPTFVFSSAEAGSSFECQLIRGGATVVDFEACTSPLTYDDQPNGAYTFNVRATDPAGNVGASATHSWNIGTVVAKPGAPGTPTATAGDASATVRWTAPTTGGAVSGYTVNAYADNGTTVSTSVSAGSTATSATVTGLTNGTPYTFEVVASNAGGSTPSARSASVTPTAAATVTAPGVPTGVTATGGNASANVSWTAPTNTGGAAVTYTVQVRTGTTVVRTISGITTTTTAVTGLTNGTAYNFRVRSVNSAGQSAYSTASNTVTPTAGTTAVSLPGAPTIGTAVAGNASATVNWTAPTNTGGGTITEYRVQVRRGTTIDRTITGVAGTATSTVVTGLTNGTAYNFRVRAVNSAGQGTLSAASNTVTPQGTTPTVTLPGAPGTPTATAGNASANVSWTAPTNTGGGAITSYNLQVRRGTTIDRTITGLTGTNTVVTGLTNGTAYNFRAQAVNSAGAGTLSAASTAVTPRATSTTATVPARPATPTATAGVAGGAITATANWTAPADGGSPITGYVVRALRMSSTGTVLQTITSAVQPATARSFQMTLPQTGNYRFTVQARNAIGNSPQSARSNQVAGR